MSRLEIYAFGPSGDAVATSYSLKNCAWFGPHVFETLCQAYRVPQQRPFDFDGLWPWAASYDGQLLWDYERLALLSFYDRAVLTARGLPVLADAYDQFTARHGDPYPEGIPALARLLRTLALDPYTHHYGFQPSNCGALWVADDGARPLNIYRDDRIVSFPLEDLYIYTTDDKKHSTHLAAAVQRLLSVERLGRRDLLPETHDEIRKHQKLLCAALDARQHT